ncbi:MAG: arsenate reductase ArsC [Acidimicrobiales bacterium]
MQVSNSAVPESGSLPTLLFVCVHNAGRSQMAAAFAERLAKGMVAASSAGSDPADAVHPEVLAVMAEIGIDLAGRRPQSIGEAAPDGADVVVTMGCGDSCPAVRSARRVEWDLPDPAGRPIDEVRLVRDLIQDLVSGLLYEMGVLDLAEPL